MALGNFAVFRFIFFRPFVLSQIAMLDIRMVNIDRNDANILVVRERPCFPTPSNSPSGSSAIKPRDSVYSDGGDGSGQTHRNGISLCPSVSPTDNDVKFRLIPIDHAYCLPDTLEIGWTDWVWLEWPQAKMELDETTKNYIASIDVEADCELLRAKLSIREPCLRLMRITTMLLKKGVARGLTLYEIAKIICRDSIDDAESSELEIVCHQATALAKVLQKRDEFKARLASQRVHSFIGANSKRSDDIAPKSMNGAKMRNVPADLPLEAGNPSTISNAIVPLDTVTSATTATINNTTHIQSSADSCSMGTVSIRSPASSTASIPVPIASVSLDKSPIFPATPPCTPILPGLATPISDGSYSPDDHGSAPSSPGM